jgi:hypothetical protein
MRSTHATWGTPTSSGNRSTGSSGRIPIDGGHREARAGHRGTADHRPGEPGLPGDRPLPCHNDTPGKTELTGHAKPGSLNDKLMVTEEGSRAIPADTAGLLPVAIYTLWLGLS